MNSIDRSLFDAIAQTDTSWIIYVNDLPLNTEYLRNDEMWYKKPVSKSSSKNAEDDYKFEDLSFFDSLNEEPMERFDYMVDQCVADKRLIVGLAMYLSGKSIDYICKRIFADKNLPDEFIYNFYRMFFPTYLKGHYSWFSIDLLVRAYKSRPITFKYLVQILIKTIDIPSGVLQDFVVNLNENHHDNIIKAIIEMKLASEEFVHHLKTINYLFLSCSKTSAVCQFILKNLEDHDYVCYNNKDYGKLLLSLAENLENSQLDHGSIKRVIEGHGTEFKVASLAAFHDVMHDFVDLRNQLQGSSRFYIRRRSDFESRRS